MENQEQSAGLEILLNGIFKGKTVIECGKDFSVFLQGQTADALFYIRRGKAKISLRSQHGKEVTVAILNAGEFFGEGCLDGQKVRMSSAVAMTDCTFDKIEKSQMERLLHKHHHISELFIKHLFLRNMRYEADLI
jgi:CRP/FNR family transcriptional regulator, cyclic AMP receptor protein